MKRRGRTIAIVWACGLAAGAAGAGLRGLDEAVRPAAADPDYIAWETCAEYIPRWLVPYMRSCVADVRASLQGDVSAGEARPAPASSLVCGFPAP